MFKNLPSTPHILLEKSVCPPRRVDSYQICKNPVQQFTPRVFHGKKFTVFTEIIFYRFTGKKRVGKNGKNGKFSIML